MIETQPLDTHDWLKQYYDLFKIFGSVRDIWEANLSSKSKRIFFCKLLQNTIKACIENTYSSFDAHTTSNCCHGIALLARNAVFAALQIDLHNLFILTEQKIKDLENAAVLTETFTDWVPESFIILSGLYLLGTVRKIDSAKRMRTEAKLLRNISPVGVEYCWVITHVMQKYFSNIVAHAYEVYLTELRSSMNIHGAPLSLWSEYIKKHHIRRDKRGICYASCVFSEQLSLAYLIKTQAKVAVVNDIIDFEGVFRGRYVCMLEGDGDNRLRPLPNNASFLNLIDSSEPIVVFGGYVTCNTLTAEHLSTKMAPWIQNFSGLLLACDLHYPQFPQVSDDTEFNNAPIIPQNAHLKTIMQQYSKIKGVSSSSPSLFCSSHTYIASVGQVISATRNIENALPTCFHGLQFPSETSWSMDLFHT